MPLHTHAACALPARILMHAGGYCLWHRPHITRHCAVPPAVALAYGAQLQGSIPMDEHDQCIDILATCSKLHYCSERARRLAAMP